ncbi:MAG: rod-binding protein [Candidatus Gastranaerophilales bacterium]|nr:rod-binding protein [Candidatus Gastranaerophilales bacterium]
MDIGNISSVYGDIYTKAAEDSASKLEGQLGKDYSEATDDELMDVCKQFEAYFLEQVMKAMVKTIPSQESESSSTNSLLSYYKDEMIKEVASESTERSGLGLAQSLYEQMKRNYGLDSDSITVEELRARRTAEMVGTDSVQEA